MMSPMHNPPHPGEILQTLYLQEIGITITAFARHIGVDRKTVSRLVNSKTHITTDMALRISEAFGTNPQFWLNMQNQYDLWHASKTLKLSHIEPIHA